MQNKLHALSVYERIKVTYGSFSKGEKQVASYVMDNYNKIAIFSSTELAATIGVSPTTVIRFTKSLGYKGYMEFRKALRENLDVTNSPYDYLKNMNGISKGKYTSSYITAVVTDAEQFVKTLDFDMVDEIINKMMAARHIYVVGLGSDSVVARFLLIYLRKMGFRVVCLEEEGSDLWESLLKINSEDFLIMSSFPRMFHDEKMVGEVARNRAVPMLTITASEVSSMMLNGDHNINAKETKKYFFNSYVLPLIFCNLLLLRIYERYPDKVEERLKVYVDLLKEVDWR